MKKYLFAALLFAVVMFAARAGLSTDPGTPETEPPSHKKLTTDIDASIRKGIRYLEKSIHKNGHYGVEVPAGKNGKTQYIADVGITGLAVLSILETPFARDEIEKEYFRKAVAYLLNNVRDSGAIVGEEGDRSTYKTAICLRVFILLNEKKYAEIIKNARDFLRKEQFDEKDKLPEDKDFFFGGWGYGGKFVRTTLPPSEFAIEGLRKSGLDADDPVFKRAVKFLARCQNLSETNDYDRAHSEIDQVNDGGARHSPTTSKVETRTTEGRIKLASYGSMTAAFIKSLLYCGVSKDDVRLRAAFRWMAKNYSLENNPGLTKENNKGKQGLFYYYQTLSKAFLLHGAHVIETPDGKPHNWAAEMSGKMLSLQRDDGSWINQFEARWFEGNSSLVTAYSLLSLANCRRDLEAQQAFVRNTDGEIEEREDRLVEIAIARALGELGRDEADREITQLGEEIAAIRQRLDKLKSTIRFEE